MPLVPMVAAMQELLACGWRTRLGDLISRCRMGGERVCRKSRPLAAPTRMPSLAKNVGREGRKGAAWCCWLASHCWHRASASYVWQQAQRSTHLHVLCPCAGETTGFMTTACMHMRMHIHVRLASHLSRQVSSSTASGRRNSAYSEPSFAYSAHKAGVPGGVNEHPLPAQQLAQMLRPCRNCLLKWLPQRTCD